MPFHIKLIYLSSRQHYKSANKTVFFSFKTSYNFGLILMMEFHFTAEDLNMTQNRNAKLKEFYTKASKLGSEINATEQRIKLIDSTLNKIIEQQNKTVASIASCEGMIRANTTNFTELDAQMEEAIANHSAFKLLRKEQYDTELDVAPKEQPLRDQLVELKQDLQRLDSGSTSESDSDHDDTEPGHQMKGNTPTKSSPSSTPPSSPVKKTSDSDITPHQKIYRELDNKLSQIYGPEFNALCDRQEKMLDTLDQCKKDLLKILDKGAALAKKPLTQTPERVPLQSRAEEEQSHIPPALGLSDEEKETASKQLQLAELKRQLAEARAEEELLRQRDQEAGERLAQSSQRLCNDVANGLKKTVYIPQLGTVSINEVAKHLQKTAGSAANNPHSQFAASKNKKKLISVSQPKNKETRCAIM